MKLLATNLRMAPLPVSHPFGYGFIRCPLVEYGIGQTMDINLKRAYEKPSKTDGMRILVERLWPRGLSKADAQVDLWAKATAPSTELRKWFDHDPEKWEEFKRRYFAELEAHAEVVDDLLQEVRRQPVTFVFASKEERYNNAVALKKYVEAQLSGK